MRPPERPSVEHPLESVSQTARRLAIAPSVLYRWIAAGDVPARLLLTAAGRLHDRRRALAAWLDGQDADTTAGTPVSPTPTPLRRVG